MAIIPAIILASPASVTSSRLALGQSTARPTTSKAGPARRVTAAEKEARAFLELVVPLLLPVSTVEADVAWVASTDVTLEHTGARVGADRATAALAGSKVIITRTKALLARQKDLDDITARQLKKLLLAAAEAPGTIPEIVSQRVEAEARQSAIQDGYTFCLQPAAHATIPARTPAPPPPSAKPEVTPIRDGAAKPGGAGSWVGAASSSRCAHPTTANDIDNVLLKSRDLGERQRVWTASKEIGRPLKPGLVELQKLRNQVAREMGYSSFFALQVADYGMSVGEMMALLDGMLEAARPLYQGLHCWAKYAMAKRFSRPVPTEIPAHWVANRWAQRWPGLVEGTSLDPYFKGSDPETIVKSAESFYTSLGFAPLPDSFWKKSDLYPVAPGQPRKKNSHASAWHIDHEQDVRSLMSVEPNEQWFGTAHHELGHIYYYLSYSRPEVPPLLREGANRAFHEAIGELARLASQEIPYLHKVGVLPANVNPDVGGWLLQSALDSIVFLPFAAGTMSHFERDLYEEELPPSEWQKRWCQYVARFQGVVPPGPRPEDGCDACTKTHINDDPAQYYDYALAWLIKFQLHDHICTKILQQDVRACDYSGQKAVGDFLRGILSQGAARDWRTVIKDATGEELSPRAMMSFYAPLVEDLARQNAGRACGWED